MPRPSPTKSAAEQVVGAVARGDDGRKYVVGKSKNGVHRWVLQRATRRTRRTVYIVDNGGMPFVVKLTSEKGPGIAQVFMRKKCSLIPDAHKDVSKHQLWLEHWRDILYQEVLVGLDPSEGLPKIPAKKGLDGNPWWYGGSSVLLKTGHRTYVFIGESIFSFKTTDDIVQYASRMGNNAVPYPYAVGTVNTYLLLHKTYMRNSYAEFLRSKMQEAGDAYNLFHWSDLEKGGEVGFRRGQLLREKYLAKHKLKQFKLLHART